MNPGDDSAGGRPGARAPLLTGGSERAGPAARDASVSSRAGTRRTGARAIASGRKRARGPSAPRRLGVVRGGPAPYRRWGDRIGTEARAAPGAVSSPVHTADGTRPASGDLRDRCRVPVETSNGHRAGISVAASP